MKTQDIRTAMVILGMSFIIITTSQEVLSQDRNPGEITGLSNSNTIKHKPLRRSNPNIRMARPLGVSLSLGGGAGLGVSFDYFVLPQLSLEAGFGAAQYVGFKYHFLGGQDDRKWSPFIGVAYCWPTLLNADSPESYRVVSLPVGIHLIARSGFSFSIAIAVSYVYESNKKEYFGYNGGEIFPVPMPGIRIGNHF